MDALLTQRLEGRPTISSLAPSAAGLVPAADRRSPRRQRRGCQPMDGACPRGGSGSPPAPPPPRCSPPVDCRTVDPFAHTPAAWGRSRWLSRTGLDLWADRRGDPPRIWHLLPCCPRGPLAQSHALESAKAGAPCPPTGRSGHHPLAGGDLAGAQKGAQAQGQTLLFIDESGFYPLPSVVRTYAPVGHTPTLREWWTRDHLSAMSGITLEGKLL